MFVNILSVDEKYSLLSVKAIEWQKISLSDMKSVKNVC